MKGLVVTIIVIVVLLVLSAADPHLMDPIYTDIGKAVAGLLN